MSVEPDYPPLGLHRLFVLIAGAASVVVLLGLTIVAGRIGMSHLQFTQANSVLLGWSRNRTPPHEEKQWRAVRSVMHDASETGHGNPAISDALGRVIRWGSAMPTMTPQDREELRSESLQYFRESLDRRPTSPFTWSNLVLDKYALDQIDPEFEHGLRMASHFGPWMPAVQRAVANAGLGAWDQLVEEDTRVAVRESVARALTWKDLNPRRARTSERVEFLVLHYGREALVCGWVGEYPELLPWCETSESGG